MTMVCFYLFVVVFLPVLKIIHVNPECEVSQKTHKKGLEKALGQMVNVIPFEGDCNFDR